jgi:prepilin-type N-terminal cleavage/methylation domain-containing protein
MPMNLGDQRGFTLAELLVASLITTLVLGGAVMMTSQVQQGFARQIEDSVGEQEGRYALEWISRMIRAAGNNPYALPKQNNNGTPSDATDDFPILSDCPAANTPYAWLIMNPDGQPANNDIRLQTDSNPPDGLLGGSTGACNQANEDVTISFDPVNHTILFYDNNLGGLASIRTDAVIENLTFVYKDSNHVATTNANNVVYIETQITIRTRTMNASTGLPTTRLLTQEVRVRGRNY